MNLSEKTHVARGGRRHARRWGCSQRERFSVTRIDRGGGRPIPRPGEPLPQGVIPHRYSLRGGDNLYAVGVSTPPRSRSCSPCTAIRSIAIHCPPPRKGAGGGREAAGRWGCSASHGKERLVETQRQRRIFHPRAWRFFIDTLPWKSISSVTLIAPPSLVGRRSAAVFRKILLKNPGSAPPRIRFPPADPPTTLPSHARASSHLNFTFIPRTQTTFMQTTNP